MTTPKPGDRVRGWFEGMVYERYPAMPLRVHPKGFPNESGIRLDALHGVEILPPPEPEWQPGDLVIDADGIAWQRSTYRWWSIPALSARDDDVMHRPLRRARIVPEDGASC